MRAGIDLDWAQLLELRAYARSRARPSQQGLSGQHHSRRGRGLIFDQVRRYQHGDDSRSIDWRVTARTGSLHTRVLCEERQHPLHLLLDLRSSLFFGSRRCLKAFLLMQLASILGWRGQAQQDPIRVSLLTDNGLLNLGRGNRRQDWLQILQRLLDHYQQQLTATPAAQPTPLMALIDSLAAASTAPTLHLLLSDWQDLDARHLGPLQALAQRQPLWLVRIQDPFDQALPEPDLVLSDGRQQRFIGRHQHSERLAWQQASLARQLLWQQLSQSSGIRCLDCSNAEPLEQHLQTLGQEL